MIKANCYSDDREIQIDFDATDFFSSLKCDGTIRDKIKAFIRVGFGGNLPSDQIAEFFEDTTTLELFVYLQDNPDVGFECRVDESEVAVWLKENDLFDLACMVNSVDAASIATKHLFGEQDFYSITYSIDLSDSYEALVCVYDGSEQECDLYGASVESMVDCMISQTETVDGWRITSVCGYDMESVITILKDIEMQSGANHVK